MNPSDGATRKNGVLEFGINDSLADLVTDLSMGNFAYFYPTKTHNALHECAVLVDRGTEPDLRSYSEERNQLELMG